MLCSVISFSWFLLTAHLVLSIVIGMAESVCTINDQSFWIVCDNDNKFRSDFFVSIVTSDILHVAVVITSYALVLVISCCTHCCFEDKNSQQIQVTLTAVLYGYTVILLWQLVPLTMHLICYVSISHTGNSCSIHYGTFPAILPVFSMLSTCTLSHL